MGVQPKIEPWLMPELPVGNEALALVSDCRVSKYSDTYVLNPLQQ